MQELLRADAWLKLDIEHIEEQEVLMVAAGAYHTVLLKSDGSAVAVGDERPGFPGKYCQIPPLSPGESYVQVAAGFGHTVLLKNDGTVVACGFDNEGQCRIPALESGVVYTQVAAGHKHTVLLTSLVTLSLLKQLSNNSVITVLLESF